MADELYMGQDWFDHIPQALFDEAAPQDEQESLDDNPEFRELAMLLAARYEQVPDEFDDSEEMFEWLALPFFRRQQALGKRLIEMQEGIERAVASLNQIDPGQGPPSNDALWEEALAELNKVL